MNCPTCKMEINEVETEPNKAHHTCYCCQKVTTVDNNMSGPNSTAVQTQSIKEFQRWKRMVATNKIAFECLVEHNYEIKM